MSTFRADIAQEEARESASRLTRRAGVWGTILMGCLVLGLAVFLGLRTYLFAGLPALPDKAAMWELNLKPNTTLLDRNGEILGHRGPHIGRPWSLTELPAHLPAAFLAIEDERFYEHPGIDRRAIMRALITNVREGEKAEGGSTLTQQLVRSMVLSPKKTYRRKVQEMKLASDMEQILSKPEILELYINRVTLGPQIFGVEAAARRYFAKPADQLDLGEAALLAGLPKAPSRYDPQRNFDGAWTRAGLVLDRMLANDMITAADRDAALASPPTMAERPPDPLSESILGYAFDAAQTRAEGLIGSARQDLVIRTTLDAETMRRAHAHLLATLDKYGESKSVSEGAVVVLENGSGGVRAMIGGRDYTETKFNRATQAERQPGSAFKMFVYAAALEDGFTPGTVRIDQPLTIGKWSPENYTKRFRGPMTMREALKLSINTVAAQIGSEVGPSRVAALATRFGIRTQMRETYSIALGSSETTLIDMTGAYMVLANEGTRRAPYLITEIEDSAGEQLYLRREGAPERVFSTTYARQMTEMLADVIEDGTAYGAKIRGLEVAGKTGTSQDYRDAWFVGYSADFTTGVWLGNDDNSEMDDVTGGLLPVDVWKDVMVDVHKGVKRRPLAKPDLPARTRRKVAFYTALSDALETERDLAAGGGGRQSAGGQ